MKMNMPPATAGDIASAPTPGAIRNVREVVVELLDHLGAELDDEVAEIIRRVRGLYSQRAGMQPGRTSEDARRRLQNHMLVTPYISHVVAALRKRRVDLLADVTTRLPALMAEMAKLEFVEAELAVATDVMREVKTEQQAVLHKTLLPQVEEAARVLFNRHNVMGWHWASADANQLARIAMILQERGPAPDGPYIGGTGHGGN